LIGTFEDPNQHKAPTGNCLMIMAQLAVGLR